MLAFHGTGNGKDLKRTHSVPWIRGSVCWTSFDSYLSKGDGQVWEQSDGMRAQIVRMTNTQVLTPVYIHTVDTWHDCLDMVGELYAILWYLKIGSPTNSPRFLTAVFHHALTQTEVRSMRDSWQSPDFRQRRNPLIPFVRCMCNLCWYISIIKYNSIYTYHMIIFIFIYMDRYQFLKCCNCDCNWLIMCLVFVLVFLLKINTKERGHANQELTSQVPASAL